MSLIPVLESTFSPVLIAAFLKIPLLFVLISFERISFNHPRFGCLAAWNTLNSCFKERSVSKIAYSGNDLMKVFCFQNRENKSN